MTIFDNMFRDSLQVALISEFGRLGPTVELHPTDQEIYYVVIVPGDKNTRSLKLSFKRSQTKPPYEEIVDHLADFYKQFLASAANAIVLNDETEGNDYDGL